MMFLLLLALTALVHADYDQPTCITLDLSTDDFPECKNDTLATRKILVPLLLNNQTGFLKQFYRVEFHDLDYTGLWDFITNTTVCRNGNDFCGDCETNFTASCTAPGCVCQYILQKKKVWLSYGQLFDEYVSLNLDYLDLNNDPFTEFSGNPSPYGHIIVDNKKRSTLTYTEPIFTKLIVPDKPIFRSIRPSTIIHQIGKRSLSSVQQSAYIEFTQPKVTVTFSSPANGTVWVTIIGKSEIVDCFNSCEFDINENWLINEQTLYIQTYIGDVDTGSATFQTEPQRWCPSSWNPFSKTWSATWDCMSAGERTFYVLGWFSIFLLFGFLTYLVYKWSCWYFDKTNYTQVTNIEMGQLPQPEPSKVQNMYNQLSEMLRARRANDGGVVLLVVLLCFSPVALACDNTLTITSTINSCVVNSTHEVCTYRPDYLTNLPFIKSSLCLSFTNSDGLAIGTGTITYDKAIREVTTRKLYYTADWKLMAASRRICAASVSGGSKAADDYCAYWNNLTFGCLTNYQSDGILSCLGFSTADNSCLSLVDCIPGEYFCTTTSNKGCGAFDFQDAHLFGKYGYLPIGNAIRVSEPDHVYFSPTVTAKLLIGNITTETTVQFNDIQTAIGPLLVTIVNQNIDNLDLFGNNKVITVFNTDNTQTVYYGPASEPNSPIAGSIGDIQGNSDTHIFDRSVVFDQFTFPVGAVTPIVRDSAMDFRAPVSGVQKQLPFSLKLPNTVNGNLWSAEESTLYILDVNPGSLNVRIESTEDIIVTRIVSTVCPNVLESFIYDNGCSNCLQGLKLNVTMKSSCASGIITMTMMCDEGEALLLTKSVYITDKYTTYLISIRPSTNYISCGIDFKGNTIDHLDFDAIVPEFDLISNDTQQSIINPPSTDDDFNNDGTYNNFLDWFNSLTGWQGAVKWVIVVIISLISLAISALLLKVLLTKLLS